MTDPLDPAASRAALDRLLDFWERRIDYLQCEQGLLPPISTAMRARLGHRIDAYTRCRDELATALREVGGVPPPVTGALGWQPIDTAPKDRLILGALIRDGNVWRVHEMKHNGLAFYTVAGGSLPKMTHWMPLPQPQITEIDYYLVKKESPISASPGIPQEPSDGRDTLRHVQEVLHGGVMEAAARIAGPIPDQARGLYRKYYVRRTDGSSEPNGKHAHCNYFVLDVTHDKHATAALVAYADSCQQDYPQLAADLRDLAGQEPFPASPRPVPTASQEPCDEVS